MQKPPPTAVIRWLSSREGRQGDRGTGGQGARAALGKAGLPLPGADPALAPHPTPMHSWARPPARCFPKEAQEDRAEAALTTKTPE